MFFPMQRRVLKPRGKRPGGLGITGKKGKFWLLELHLQGSSWGLFRSLERDRTLMGILKGQKALP